MARPTSGVTSESNLLTTTGDLPKILQAIHASQMAVESKIYEVHVDVELLHQDLSNATGRLTESEEWLSTAEDEIAELKSKVSRLLSQSAELHNHAEDAENRSGHNT
ncbi:hypothetical protein NDU88_007160 [Pleurodeles waltl]|uniref:Dynein heavy chain coiled coil stalk domain-containing protein n=1 Tax=Pleurodeles waltl TaxID=8319 RepID=A0AAV7NSB2_PLEWA|nr:hypothetical protein NDU88_007160 [Pleurodeles waltl]